ncbi:MAG: sn-glycerol-3-phosphate ABC transporter ATP-binding protein UgpC [Acidobacteriota bacterium]|nr:sn-glycerol-3-phosphate ABC transporter ATP-binding protein UgpC [Acidobacteriota bacterium]MDE3138963.1 sn-glycerol-3-phosphate ABC transporter ATP-binding protein UgpC [Acidobacteriota bacterium]
MAEIIFDRVAKVYPGGNTAVQDLSLHVADGEFMVLVGPSGCGKTTALRMIAGLEEISDGTISIGGRVVNNVLPKDRDIAMVFQNYALYPQMTVGENMGFALKIRNVAKDEIRRRVEEAAQILRLSEYLDRRPKALSGGQRQRVAMGRAIVREPQAFLMDEPLSNLDAQLRVEMRTEISRIQRLLGVATIYVTHDQTEAMTMGDRVAVMRGGVLQQVATPEDLYDHPVNSFVAGFIGSPPMNLLSATLVEVDGALRARFGDQSVAVPAHYRASHRLDEVVSGPVVMGVRPEDLIVASPDAEGRISATVTLREALGSEILAHVSFGGEEAIVSEDDAASGGHSSRVVARLGARAHVAVGGRVDLTLNPDNLHFFDAQTGESLRRSR